MIEGMEKIVREHRFFAGLSDETIALVAGCTRTVVFDAGQSIAREGDSADEFFLIRHGRVALELSAPGRGAITIQTIREGEVAGMSWLIPPYRWTSSARAVEAVRAIGIDARCLRRKCDADSAFGYTMMMRFVPVLVDRLQASRLQLLDVYGKSS
jgi:CRP/FNR family cyclic AMP-dependent transcriptional regulator